MGFPLRWVFAEGGPSWVFCFVVCFGSHPAYSGKSGFPVLDRGMVSCSSRCGGNLEFTAFLKPAEGQSRRACALVLPNPLAAPSATASGLQPAIQSSPAGGGPYPKLGGTVFVLNALRRVVPRLVVCVWFCFVLVCLCLFSFGLQSTFGLFLFCF